MDHVTNSISLYTTSTDVQYHTLVFLSSVMCSIFNKAGRLSIGRWKTVQSRNLDLGSMNRSKLELNTLASGDLARDGGG